MRASIGENRRVGQVKISQFVGDGSVGEKMAQGSLQSATEGHKKNSACTYFALKTEVMLKMYQKREQERRASVCRHSQSLPFFRIAV